jgi:uncharacterized membrane protein
MNLREAFVTGLLVLVPIAATFFIIYWVVSLIERTISPFISAVFGFYFPGLGLALLLLLILMTGFFARIALFNRVITVFENALVKIPVIRTVYSGVKEASRSVFFSEPERLKGVVLLEYPRKGVFALGFTTGAEVEEACEATGKKLVNVFIPTSPNPTSGLVLLVPEEEMTYLDMSVEDAMKVVISGGFSK